VNGEPTWASRMGLVARRCTQTQTRWALPLPPGWAGTGSVKAKGPHHVRTPGQAGGHPTSVSGTQHLLLLRVRLATALALHSEVRRVDEEIERNSKASARGLHFNVSYRGYLTGIASP
jgi:hypothetical protein